VGSEGRGEDWERLGISDFSPRDCSYHRELEEKTTGQVTSG